MKLRAFLNGLPTPIKVVLWLAASAALTAVANSVSGGQVKLDASTLAVVNVVLVTLRELLDKVAPPEAVAAT